MNKKIIIFDLDGTLAKSKQPLTEAMSIQLVKLLEKYAVAITSGAKWEQFQTQFLQNLAAPAAALEKLFLFPTCGAAFWKWSSEQGWHEIYAENFTEAEAQKITAALEQALVEYGHQPEQMWGEMIENRGSQITFSALGQEAPLEAKSTWDPDHQKRQEIIKILQPRLPDYDIKFGGSSSIDITRRGVDKAYAIAKIQEHLGFQIAEMLFVGDDLRPGGNDYAVLRTGVDARPTSDPEETVKIIEELL